MQRFSPPVRVLLGKHGSVTFNVSSAEEAAERLVHDWPTDSGPKLMSARRAVLKALENAGDAKRAMAARKAFEAAAIEADVLMPPVPPRSEMGALQPWRGKRRPKRDIRP